MHRTERLASCTDRGAAGVGRARLARLDVHLVEWCVLDLERCGHVAPRCTDLWASPLVRSRRWPRAHRGGLCAAVPSALDSCWYAACSYLVAVYNDVVYSSPG